jgi:hypothetical protein
MGAQPWKPKPLPSTFESELQFLRGLGFLDGSQPLGLPFYMRISGWLPEHEIAVLLPRLRALALELTSDDVTSMLKMHWRILKVAAWLTIARCDPLLSGPVHEGFDYCYGSLSSTSLTVAALVYPNERTAEMLTGYRDWAIARKVEVAGGVVDAALLRLSGGSPDDPTARSQEWLEMLLSRAKQLQALAD